MAELAKTNPLYETIQVEGKAYITSHLFHRDVHPTGSLSATNKAIRRAETYTELADKKHIIEVNLQVAENISNSILESLIKTNSYKPLMLIDPVAQKAIEHHFKETAVQAVHSSKESATLSMSGINLELIAQDKHYMALLRSISASKEASLKAKEMEKRMEALERKVKLMTSDTGYTTVLAYSKISGTKIPLLTAKQIGIKAKAECKILGYPVGKVPDERFGQINSYPKDVLQGLFRQEGLMSLEGH